MPVKCENCPLRKQPLFTEMSQKDIERTQRFKSGELSVDAGTDILAKGANIPQLYTVLRGMGVRSKNLPDGRRQVINLVFPGDFIGLQAGVMGEMSHAVQATTDMILCVFDRKDFYEWFSANPTRAFDLTWLAATEEHFLGDALMTLGQRTAIGGLAWALLRIHARCTQTGMARDGAVPMPFRQQDIADALGLSLVHTNKTLSRLRERQLLSWSDGQLQIHDPEALMQLAQIESADLPQRPLI